MIDFVAIVLLEIWHYRAQLNQKAFMTSC